MLFNDAVATSECIYSQIGWKDANEYLAGMDLEKGSNGLY
jgi:hypothetical protein